jgi:hypothetical protein
MLTITPPMRFSKRKLKVLYIKISCLERVEPWSGQTEDYKIGICSFSANHAALRRKSKDWLAYDILIPLIKNLELQPVQHLLKLVSSLDQTAHTESVSITHYFITSKRCCSE